MEHDSTLQIKPENTQYHLQNFTRIKHVLSREQMQNCVYAFIACSKVAANATILWKVELISAVLKSLPWLPESQRIDFKILILGYKTLDGLRPKYILDLLVPCDVSKPVRPSGTGLLCVLRIATKNSEVAFCSFCS